MSLFQWNISMRMSTLWLMIAPLHFAADAAFAAETAQPYAELVAADKPVAWWRFDDVDAARSATPEVGNDSGLPATEPAQAGVKFHQEGPRPPVFPAFPSDNHAAGFNGKASVVKVADPGENSPLDFTAGDAITLEAWVNVTKLSDGQQMYVFGKGRTKNAGFPAENQNYALRLAGQKGLACVSFLFRDADNGPRTQEDYHRWTSTDGFGVDSGWHHIAVTYTFGQADSLVGYLDGQAVPGKWDYGGATAEAPVVDNDELWIGSSLGVSAGSTFQGQLDEVALYRTALAPERIAARVTKIVPQSYVTADDLLPRDAVLVEVFHSIPDKFTWEFALPEPFERFTRGEFAMVELPQHYTSHGVRGDRTNPLVVRLSGWVTWPAGDVRLGLRSRSAARVWVDGELVGENLFNTRSGDGHGELYPMPDNNPAVRRPVQPGDSEVAVTFRANGRPQRVQMDVWVGGKKHRPELGELALTWTADNGVEQLVGYGETVPFRNAEWLAFVSHERQLLQQVNRERRQTAAQGWTDYWNRRHQRAREALPAATPPPQPAGDAIHNDIDRFIQARLTAENVEPLPLVDDLAFLRRVCLDILGTIPSPELVAEFQHDVPAGRRARWIDRLLAMPGWADHWVGYWQDVLAENPNLINPTLNNTGPFRWWLHESFADNKPFDRFATELILMEGSTHYGGPAGFALATQNDAPMAAKAHILAQAFLGMEMKCARCHDAPYHQFSQKDLFSLAAMLNRGEVKLPKTSTIPGDPAALQSLLVKVSLKPGEPIPAEWPFSDELSGSLATDMLVNAADRREQLAALVTSSANHRFAQVIVNRMWQRYLGRGLVEPVDDWEHAAPSHPELLDFLERALIQSGYDLKHVARLIFNAHVYQRQADAQAAASHTRAALFAGPFPRRMTAEQVADSLLVASGKTFRTEELNIDVDGLRTYEQSLNLGPGLRAWQFTSLSNERDRPALALPAAQTVVDVLETFGWRGARPDPLTVRPQETTVLQPAVIANGVLGRRAGQLSEDSRFTAWALRPGDANQFVRDVYLAVLSRLPTPVEERVFVELLSDGYADRVVANAATSPVRPLPHTGVSWTNHLKPEASDRKIALQRELEQGDPPSPRLQPDWRERAEDFVWTLLNSPEFVFVP